ncbi:unnamed protein product, partial [Meganyctiphanes norvegica]
DIKSSSIKVIEEIKTTINDLPIPAHQVVPAPLTCPEVTTTPCPTSNMITEGGLTVTPDLPWLTVARDRFVRFAQEINWIDAQSLCQSHGLALYQPLDIVAVAQYLEDNFSDKLYWLGAQGNGTHQVWLSGEVLDRSDPWYGTQYTNVGTSYCLYFITWSGEPAKGTVLATAPCVSTTNVDVICG